MVKGKRNRREGKEEKGRNGERKERKKGCVIEFGSTLGKKRNFEVFY